MPFFTKAGRNGEKYEWTRTSTHQSIFADLRAKPRLSWIESLPVFIPNTRVSVSPSKTGTPRTSYQKIPNSEHVEKQGQNEKSISAAVRPVSPLSASEEVKPLPLTRSNLAQLEDVRFGEVAHTAQLKNRISTVSQYPVIMNASPSNDSRRRSRRMRPASIASTSTNGIYVAVGQLPGSQPFDLEPPSQAVLSRHSGIPAQHVASQHKGTAGMGQEDSVYETAQAVQVQIVGSQNNRSRTSVNRISIISKEQGVDGSPQRRRTLSASGANQFPPRVTSFRPPPGMKTSHTWPEANVEQLLSTGTRAAGQSTSEHKKSESLRLSIPPPPPPKDPGYISKRPAPNRGSRLRHWNSSPHLPLNATPRPSAMERVGIIKERSGPTEEKSSHRSWFGGLLNHTWSPRSPRSPKSPLRRFFSYRRKEFAR
jgi:hypothetical protein